MVGASRCRMYATTTETLDDLIVTHVDLDDIINANARIFHAFRLADGAWEAVE